MNKSYFWNSAKWEVNQDGIGKEIHPLVAMFAAVALGGLFVVFLPFIGLYLFCKQMAVMASKPVRELFQTSVAPTAAPGAAYFTGSPGKDEQGDSLEELSKEIQEHRVK